RAQEITSADQGASWTYVTQINHGDQPFSSPHSIAIDQQGKLYAGDASGNVYEYVEENPQLSLLKPLQTRQNIAGTEGLMFEAKHNQADTTCNVLVKATVSVPPGPHVFTVENHGTVGDHYARIKVDLTGNQVSLLEKAWNSGHKVSVV